MLDYAITELRVDVLRTEIVSISHFGNRIWRFVTDRGDFITEIDLHKSHELTGSENGPATLRIDAARLVLDWTFD